ncbi:MAG: helix-turn-helix transcriptional regulator [Tumebacillaceae bacterium]
MTMFAKRLRELRKRHDWTQERVAEKMGVEKTTISNYETETRTPGPETLMRLAQLFDVSLDYLVGLTDTEKPYDSESRIPSGLSERLSQRRALIGYSEKEVAERLKLTDRQLSIFERGHRAPDLLTLKQLAPLYDTTTDYLLGCTDDPDRVYSVRELRDLFASGRVKLANGEPMPQEDQDFFVKLFDLYLK